MLLNEKDFNIYCEKQPWKIISRDLCPLCYSSSISWMVSSYIHQYHYLDYSQLYPCKHKFCCSNTCITGLENNLCIFKFDDCRVLYEKDAIKG